MSLQIFILGTLSEGDRHPYDIKKQVMKPLDGNVTINDGTLYYQFEVLAKKGLIRKIEVVQTDNRPEKTTYGITEKGRKALEEEIYAAFQKFTSAASLYSSLMFLDKVDKQKLSYLIREAVARLESRIRQIEESDPELGSIPDAKRTAVRLIIDHADESIRNDIRWLRKVLEQLNES
ncbi:PadR family transcriptional regulator [Paenibacillus sp. P22]|uniref:PadR family transcriptional regulator n=1 Tax=Paenibacillus TaxID=44249 RepID=UPI000660E7AC|nr:PadR family transcriptional regulator [Paenibacillus sp. P22]